MIFTNKKTKIGKWNKFYIPITTIVFVIKKAKMIKNILDKKVTITGIFAASISVLI